MSEKYILVVDDDPDLVETVAMMLESKGCEVGRAYEGIEGEESIKEYKKGQMVKAVVLDVDMEKERISLGVKQLEGDPMESAEGLRRNAAVTCEVTAVQDNGIEVAIAGTDLTAFIRRGDLARDRSEQRPDRFAVGEKVDARITQLDKSARKISVSIKALEIAEEKAAVAQYGSSDSGASLGDILGAALAKADAAAPAAEEPAEEPAVEEAAADEPAEEPAAEEAAADEPAEEPAAEEAAADEPAKEPAAEEAAADEPAEEEKKDG